MDGRTDGKAGSESASDGDRSTGAGWHAGSDDNGMREGWESPDAAADAAGGRTSVAGRGVGNGSENGNGNGSKGEPAAAALLLQGSFSSASTFCIAITPERSGM